MIAPAPTVQQRKQLTLRHSTSTAPQRDFWQSDARFRLFMGGVGSGKTRAGCVEVLRQPPGTTGMVLAPTYPMLRDATLRTFMELVFRGGILKQWHKSEMTVELIDGKTVMFRSADDPDRLRGPNLGWFYLDEAAMMDRDVWDIMIGRLRERPGRAWATTTPRGRNWLSKKFDSGPDYKRTRSSTRQNPYLPPEFIQTLERSYTRRMLRQEVEGEEIEDVEGALWTLAQIDALRADKAPAEMLWVSVGVDPAVTSKEDSDETGIIVAGRAWCSCKGTADKHYFVLQDATVGIVAPTVWASAAVNAYHRHEANVIAAEVNNGGDLIQTLIRGIDNKVPVRKVHASRGKLTRAEPVSMLYEQCIAKGTIVDTARGPVLIEKVTTDDHVWTRNGLRRVLWAGQTGVKPTVKITFDEGQLTCTPDHPVYVAGKGYTHAEQLVPNRDILVTWNYIHAQTVTPPSQGRGFGANLARLVLGGKKPANQNAPSLSSTASGITSRGMATGEQVDTVEANSSIGLFGKRLMDLCRQVATSIIAMGTRATTPFKTLSLSPQRRMAENMLPNFTLMKLDAQFQNVGWDGGQGENLSITSATNAESHSLQLPPASASALRPVTRGIGVGSVVKGSTLPVYNLHVEDTPEFFAQGVLVHNCKVHHVGTFPLLEDQMCTYVAGMGDSPDRMDALVWAITELSRMGGQAA